MQVTESDQKFVDKTFGDVGRIVLQFNCAAESVMLIQGRLYITESCICFYSSILGAVTKKIRIPYAHVESIEKQISFYCFKNAIVITSNAKKYVFRSFIRRDLCFDMIRAEVAKIKRESDGPNDNNNTSDNELRGSICT